MTNDAAKLNERGCKCAVIFLHVGRVRKVIGDPIAYCTPASLASHKYTSRKCIPGSMPV